MSDVQWQPERGPYPPVLLLNPDDLPPFARRAVRRRLENKALWQWTLLCTGAVALCVGWLCFRRLQITEHGRLLFDTDPFDVADVRTVVFNFTDEPTHAQLRLAIERPHWPSKIYRTRLEVYSSKETHKHLRLSYILWAAHRPDGPANGTLAVFSPGEHGPSLMGCISGSVYDLFYTDPHLSPVWDATPLVWKAAWLQSSLHLTQQSSVLGAADAFWDHDDACTTTAPSIPVVDGGSASDRPDVATAVYRLTQADIEDALRTMLRLHRTRVEYVDTSGFVQQLHRMQLNIDDSIVYRRDTDTDPHLRGMPQLHTGQPRLGWTNCSALRPVSLRRVCKRLHNCHRSGVERQWVSCSCIADTLAAMVLPETLSYPRHCSACDLMAPEAQRRTNCMCWAKWLLARQALLMQPCLDDAARFGGDTVGLCGTHRTMSSPTVTLHACPMRALQPCISQRTQWRWGGCLLPGTCDTPATTHVRCDADWDGQYRHT